MFSNVIAFLVSLIGAFSIVSQYEVEVNSLQIKEVNIYYSSKKEKVNVSNLEKSIEEEINKCLDNITDIMKVVISAERMQNIKRGGGVEIIFSSDIEYRLKNLNVSIKFEKLFIPISGKFEDLIFFNDIGPPYSSKNCEMKKIFIGFKIRK